MVGRRNLNWGAFVTPETSVEDTVGRSGRFHAGPQFKWILNPNQKRESFDEGGQSQPFKLSKVNFSVEIK